MLTNTIKEFNKLSNHISDYLLGAKIIKLLLEVSMEQLTE